MQQSIPHITSAKWNRTRIAMVFALLCHIAGLVGILYIDRPAFVSITPFILLFMFLLLVWTHHEKTTRFWIFIFIAVVFGISVEITGIKTGVLFGSYRYGNVLGPKIEGVPIVMGLTWFMIVYCSGSTIAQVLSKVRLFVSKDQMSVISKWKTYSLVFDSALLAVFFDWLMEPVAVKLGYWYWLEPDGASALNYVCWFGVSFLLMILFGAFRIKANNLFAVHLLLIQLIFFLALRNFL